MIHEIVFFLSFYLISTLPGGRCNISNTLWSRSGSSLWGLLLNLLLNWSHTVPGRELLNTVVVDLGWGRLHFRLWGLWDLLAEVWLVGSLVVVVVSVESQEELALLDVLQLISVVVLTSVNTLWVFALTAELVRADLVDGSDGTSVLTWVSIQTDKVLSAVFWVSVTGEGAWVGVILLVGAHESSVVF